MKKFKIIIILLTAALLLPLLSCAQKGGSSMDAILSGEASPTASPTDSAGSYPTLNMEQYETEDIYNISSALEPTGGAAKHKEALQLRKEGKYEDCIQLLDEAIEIYPGKAGLWFSKGKTLILMGEFSKAEECLIKSATLKPSPEAWYSIGIVKAYTGKYNEAIDSFNRSIKMESTPDAWYSKGITFDDMEKNQEAVECFNKVLEMNDKFPVAWYAKGMALLQLNRYDEAKDAFRQADKLKYPRAAKALQALSEKGF